MNIATVALCINTLKVNKIIANNETYSGKIGKFSYIDFLEEKIWQMAK